MSQRFLRLLGKSAHQARGSASLLPKSTATRALVSIPQTFGSLSPFGSGLGHLAQPHQHRSFTASQIALSSFRDEDALDGDDFLSVDNPHWEQTGLDPRILAKLGRNGITKFTPVQGEAFAHVINGKDVIGRSRTGTGKTLAFGLPAMTRLVDHTIQKGTRDPDSGWMRKGRSVSMIVLCPTRELARQVADELSLYAGILGLNVACFHGGVSYNPQHDAIRQGIDILVGTPGRVFDHIDRGSLNLNEVNIAVLDEADEMLNMGFAEQVEQVLKGMGHRNSEKTQCLMFSATTPDWVEKLGRKYQENPVSIDSTGDEGGARVANTVRHAAVELPHGTNKNAVIESVIVKQLQLVGDEQDGDGRGPSAFGKTIIFTDTKRHADDLVAGNSFNVLRAKSLHGDHSQNARDITLDQFREGKFDVLVATDVAARGIDIKEVDLVVQMSPPNNVDTYVHRSGRTGRAGRKGAAIVIASRPERRSLIWIERDLGHDFRFEFLDPPSLEDALAFTLKTTTSNIRSLPAEHIDLFRGAADELISEYGNDPQEIVSRCLAAMNKNSIENQESGYDEDNGMGYTGGSRQGRRGSGRQDSRGFGGGRQGGRGGGGGGRGGGGRRYESYGSRTGGGRRDNDFRSMQSRRNDRGNSTRFSGFRRQDFADDDDYY